MNELRMNGFEALAMDEMMAVDGGSPAGGLLHLLGNLYGSSRTYSRRDKMLGRVYVKRPAVPAIKKICDEAGYWL